MPTKQTSRTVRLLSGENQSVRITVAIEAAIKAIEHCFAMGEPVTLLTGGNIAMTVAVTIGTLKLRVLFSGTGKQLDSLFVTTGAGCGWSLFAKMNFGRFVNRVTADTTTVVNKNSVWFIVTFNAVGDISVATVVTLGTINFCVSAWILVDFTRL
jgi:hypothetical protein